MRIIIPIFMGDMYLWCILSIATLARSGISNRHIWNFGKFVIVPSGQMVSAKY